MTALSEAFLAALIADLQDETTQAIILHGSYVRGEALPPYSDVDLVHVRREEATGYEGRRFLYREGYLLSISSRPLSVYRQRFQQPEQAIFTLLGIREARILLDHEGAFQQLQQEALKWTWEPLQPAANAYASQRLVNQTEIILKLLRALFLSDRVALSEMILDLVDAVTEAVAVAKGILIRSGNTYFRQVQETMGLESIWTQYHTCVTGSRLYAMPLEERAEAALLLYQESVRQLSACLRAGHRETIEQTLQIIEQALPQKKIS